jgi:hypothetical protein
MQSSAVTDSGVIPFPQEPASEVDPRFLGFEQFVDENVIAAFLALKPRRVLELARKGELPAYGIGHERKTWRFRVSEVSAHFSTPIKKPASVSMATAVPGASRRF